MNSLPEYEYIDRYWDSFKWKDHLNTPYLIKKKQIGGNIVDRADLVHLFKELLKQKDLSFNVDGEYIESPVIDQCGFEDGDFFSYLNGIKNLNNGEVITLTKDYCLPYSLNIYEMVSYFSKHYLENFGLPSSGINAVAIAGHYSETWIGLHNDYCETFLTSIAGNKYFYLWPPEYFESYEKLNKPNAMNGYCLGNIDIEVHKNMASIYEVEPGDIFYIPKKWWHYNKLANPEDTLTLSIGFFDDPSAYYAGDICNFKKSRKKRIYPPKENLVSRDFIGSIVESNSKENTYPHIIDILSRLSSNGIGTNPLDIPSELPLISKIGKLNLVESASRIYILRIKNNHGFVFSRGEVKLFDHIELIVNFVDSLCQEKEISCSDYLGASSPSIENLIRWLIFTGSVRII